MEEKKLSSIITKEWPSHLLPINESLKSRKLLYRLGSAVSVISVGLLSKVLTKMNSFTVHNHDVFLKAANDIPDNRDRPLITICNHHSCLDDPTVWGALLPWSWQIKSTRHRWTAAADDICFTKPLHSLFFALGHTFPVERGKGIYQPAMDFAIRLILQKQLLHVFPQGKVCEEPDLNDVHLVKKQDHRLLTLSDKSDIGRPYQFKWGLARLILDALEKGKSSFDAVEILPFYHLGMDKILPNLSPYIPRLMKKVTIFIRKEGPIVFDGEFINLICQKFPPPVPSIEGKRISICKFLEDEMRKLKLEAMKRHLEIKSSSV